MDDLTFRYDEPGDEDDESNEDDGRPGILERTGNFFIFLTSADRHKIGSTSERNRYITIGFLMLVTAAQGFYAACLFTSIGFNRRFDHVLGYGAFFALAVFLIDRSIIGYVHPAKVDAEHNLQPRSKWTPIVVTRLVIAAAAAVLMSEMVLLQFFARDINEQIQQDHTTTISHSDTQVNAIYQKQIDPLKSQITAAQNTVTTDQQTYTKAQHEADCQEFGCPGITAGIGPGFRAAQAAESTALQNLQTAQANLQTVTANNDRQIHTLNAKRAQAINSNQGTILSANALLTREEAFWQLTTKYGTVLFWRVLLTLLILGVNLAPLLTKLTGKTTVHDAVVRGEEYVALQLNSEYVWTQELGNRGRERLQRERDSTEMETELKRILANADVTRFEIRLNTDLRKRRFYRFYMSGRSQARTSPKSTIPMTDPLRPNGQPNGRHGRSPDDTPTSRYPTGGPGRGPAGEPGTRRDPDGDAGQRDTRRDTARYRDLAEDEYIAFQELAPPDPGEPGGHYRQDIADDVAEIIFGAPWEGLVLDGRWALREPMPGADRGGGGMVWRAKDVDDGTKWYVVKTIPANFFGPPEASGNLRLRSFRSEMRIKDVESDHIGEICDFGKDKNLYYIVYPMYRPGSLAQYCLQDGGNRTLNWCFNIVEEILAGLIDASGHGFVHLDIKPGNIVLDGERVRIIDWGLCRMWQSADGSYTLVARGTPFYASPEQILRQARGWDKPVADLYGVGAVFYWLITNEPPLRWDATKDAKDAADLFTFTQLIVRGVRPQPVHELVPGVPPQLGQLIDQWLSYDPAGRVAQGTPPDQVLRAARDELAALKPITPAMTVGMVSGRRRDRGNGAAG